MPMEIEDPETSKFLPLLGAFNFEYQRSSFQDHPKLFGFGINWEKAGGGQEILREHLRTKTRFRIRYQGREYQGVHFLDTEFNTPNGTVMAQEVA